MSQTQESQCTQLIHFDGASPSAKELKEDLEGANVDKKIEAMKKVIMLHLNGEPQSSLTMTIIRFVLPNDNHTLKKLTLYFLEIIDKTDAQGRLLPEMILVCNFIRNDLQHPNEYVRGCTLRFVCKVKEMELIEPLTDSILTNLDNRHSYVRRNAILAVFTVFQRFPHLLPDGPELIEGLIENESDATARRNAFIMLFNAAPERAVRYLRKAIDLDITSTGEHFQLAVVDLLRHLCKTNPQEKSQYLRVIFSLLSSKSAAVLFQCANTLLTLSTSPTAIRESAGTFVKLLSSHGDNNVRLLVLDRLEEIKKRFPDILSEMLMDLLRTLNTPNLDIRRKVLDLCLDLVREANVDKAVQFLKKEVVRTQGEVELDKQASQEYRQSLVRCIHQCVVRHPVVANQILPVLSDYVIEAGPSAVDVILFMREIMQKQPDLREEALNKLLTMFPSISSPRVLRIALWIFSVHSRSPDEITRVLEVLKDALGPFPLIPAEKGKSQATAKSSGADTGDDGTAADASKTATLSINKDGTYVTTLLESAGPTEGTPEQAFRNHLVTGDFFLASVVCSTVTKLVLSLYSMEDVPQHQKTSTKNDVLSILVEILNLGNSSVPIIDDDSHERICLCKALLQNTSSTLSQEVLPKSIAAFADLVQDNAKASAAALTADQKKYTPVDSSLIFSQLAGVNKSAAEVEIEVEDVQLATSNQQVNRKSDFLSKLNKVIQLTGRSDPIYSEATVTVHQYDILLDILVVNQSDSTMQNLTVELATMGDLKLCERPQSYTLASHESIGIKANIKVSSTETGVIFGNIVYDSATNPNDRSCVILNDIHIDIMDYITPATCTATQFRSMWAEFEWENKVVVNTEVKSLREYLDTILKHTNMKCLTSDSSLEGDCDFLSANLYAKSSFGEDALANISVERHMEGRLEGFVRIRSKTQGIALSLGDKITMKQKG
jgi:coatomer subunit beta|eukprot:CAMPEP_0174292852 /NCGR_PEP_ID=MMETSP0809-20121228/36684_1 /TAXON_ID=73025 ORGANISM="Eutreptiella gymnastica-like, Strain CCMP1594" /NCGR_SAMPLE_ID=MMETSP0809 /ASSEMBLY_ACC=CAM_ASM_000658 /LENGTH=947 /DNA_ID=CAMNT_0015393183 /DNA_START=17 /DNA_END=2860 /DNA_ORIENTATION=-